MVGGGFRPGSRGSAFFALGMAPTCVSGLQKGVGDAGSNTTTGREWAVRDELVLEVN